MITRNKQLDKTSLLRKSSVNEKKKRKEEKRREKRREEKRREKRREEKRRHTLAGQGCHQDHQQPPCVDQTRARQYSRAQPER